MNSAVSSSAKTRRTGLLVLGMHRSGTSATTRWLNLLGASLPGNLMEALADNNAEGFWESRDVCLLNDELLQTSGSCWDDWRNLDQHPPPASTLETWRKQAGAQLREDFEQSSLFVLKDPRICRLLPQWQPVFEQFDTDIRCVLPLRHPLEVARSLTRRDGFHRDKACLLWLRHVLDAEYHSRGLPRVWLDYAALLDNWERALAQLNQTLDLELAPADEAIRGQINAFLNPAHQHQKADDTALEQEPGLDPDIKRTWAALKRLIERPDDEQALRALDDIRAALNAADARYGHAFGDELRQRMALKKKHAEEAHQLREQLAERASKVLSLETLAAQRRAEIGEVQAKLKDRVEKVQSLEQLAKQRLETLRTTRASLENRIAKVEELRDALKANKLDTDSLRQQLQERARKIDRLEQVALERREALAQQRRREKHLQSQLHKLQDAHAQQGAALQQAEQTGRQQQAALKQLREQHKALQAKQRESQRREAITTLLQRRGSTYRALDFAQDALPPRRYCGIKLSLRQRRALRTQTRQLLASGLFDLPWYLDTQPDLIEAAAHPVWHWLLVGWREGRSPHWLFDPHWYLQQNPDVAASGSNPLLHYLTAGHQEDRAPSALFNPAWYGAQGPALKPGQSALEHYLREGQFQGLSPNRYFDGAWYLNHNPDVADAGLGALDHYLSLGWREGRDPSPLLWNDWYLASNPDVREAQINPLRHFVEHGQFEGRDPNPVCSADHYWRQLARGKSDAPDPLGHYLHSGWQAGLDPSAWFDTDWYLARNPDVREAGANPLMHFLYHGLDEGRDPGPAFNSSWYLNEYPDVAENAACAFRHYLEYGRQEGRAPRAPAPQIEPARCPITISSQPGERHINPDWPHVLVCAHAAHGQLFGGERSFIDILALLAELPYNVHVVVPSANPDYLAQLAPLSCHTAHIPYRYWRRGEAPQSAAIDGLKAYMIRHKITLVHVNTIVVREPLIAARELGIPCATHVRESVHDDSWLSRMVGLTPDQIVAKVTAQSDCIIANSRHSAAEFDKPGATFVVPNTFDMQALDLPNQRAADGTLSVGLISSNIAKKGLEDFALLATACAEHLPQLRFKLIGPDNDEVAALRARQQAGELGDNLEFVGYQDSPQEALAQVNVVMNLSHFAESFGRTVAEGLTARRPVIVYDLGAAKDLVSPGENGWVIRHGHWRDAIEPLEQLCTTAGLLERMGEAGRQAMQMRYGREIGVQALQTAYQHLQQTHEPPAWPRVLPAPRFNPPQAPAPLRLAYFCWHFPVPSETFVLNELRELVAAGVDVTVFCRQSPHADFKPDFEISWQRVSSPQELAEQLRAHARTLVHAHFTYPTVTDMVWPACEQADVPFSFIAHAQDIFKYDNDRLNRVGEIARAPLCKAVFTLGRFHRDFLLARGVPAEKLHINPNSIDTTRFRYRPPRLRPHGEPLQVCAIHRLTEKKGLHDLIRAAELLRDEAVQINMYGYGDEEPRLRDLIAELGLSSCRLHGALNGYGEIVDVLDQHDLFACPSVRTASGDMDGIPTVLLESMATGTPVLTTQIASIPDLVQDGVTGLMVNANDPQSLADGIRRFAGLDSEQILGLSVNGRNAVLRRHDNRRLTRNLLRQWRDEVIDIVIVSWNNVAELEAIVAHLFAHTRSNFHLSICDNASEPDVVAFLFDLQRKRDNVSVIHRGDNTFVGPGTNSAADQGRAPYVIYVCGKEGFALADGWESDMADYMDAHPEVGLAGSTGYSPTYLTGAQLPDGIAKFADFRNQDFAQQHPERIFKHVQGGLFIMRRAMYDEIGGFSEQVPHSYTDVEYSYYAESRGWKLGQIDSVLALFNKTVPNIWSRVDEHIKVIHPPRLVDLPRLHAISQREIHVCNICEWSAPRYLNPDYHSCPNCGAQPAHRSLYRYLAEGMLTYRRLPALWINPHPCLETFWSKSFQGRRLNHGEITGELDQKGQLDTATDALSLVVIQDCAVLDHPSACAELARVLSPQGELVLILGEHGNALAHWSQQLGAHGLTQADEALYASETVCYDTRRMLVFRADTTTH